MPSVKRVANEAVVYLVHDDNKQLQTVIIPIKGYGLWSTMYAFLAVEPDLNTIRSLVYSTSLAQVRHQVLVVKFKILNGLLSGRVKSFITTRVSLQLV